MNFTIITELYTSSTLHLQYNLKLTLLPPTLVFVKFIQMCVRVYLYTENMFTDFIIFYILKGNFEGLE